MIKLLSLCKRAMIISSISFVFVSCVACSSGKTEALTIEKEEGAVDQEKSQVLNRMTPKQQVDFSKQDLATRLGLDESAIQISGATPVNWRSGALGCPKPGMSYTDVLVPGVLIYLRVGNTAYRYHAIPNGQPFYCPKEWAEPPAVGPGAD